MRWVGRSEGESALKTCQSAVAFGVATPDASEEVCDLYRLGRLGTGVVDGGMQGQMTRRDEARDAFAGMLVVLVARPVSDDHPRAPSVSHSAAKCSARISQLQRHAR